MIKYDRKWLQKPVFYSTPKIAVFLTTSQVSFRVFEARVLRRVAPVQETGIPACVASLPLLRCSRRSDRLTLMSPCRGKAAAGL